MERVQFQQEQMLAELKDLVDKNVFTLKETKAIMKKRTIFEAGLVRRVAKKSDFLRYAAYEMGLEQLRRKRVERLDIPRTPVTVSDYALVRRQFHIFERALKRFRADVGLWIQYIEVAKREGARTLVGRITARALQLHPNTCALYILAASHELDHHSPSSARALLQRGIRLNPESVDMWTEYIRMELGFIESLRRRWDILGIDETSEDQARAAEKDKALLVEEIACEDDVLPITGPAQDNGDHARKEILKGAIVKSILSNAAQAVPKIELFEPLNELITHYPLPQDLRDLLILHLDSLLRSTVPDHPRTIQILCTRCLRPNMDGDELVDGIKQANETLLRATDSRHEQVLSAYADFVEEWSRAAIDENLKLYLIASLERLVQREKASPSLARAHINLLTQRADGETALKWARLYTYNVPSAAGVWLARLDLERRHGTRESVDQAWGDARRSVSGTNDEVLSVWLWGLAEEREYLEIHETLLKESMKAGQLWLHEQLLIKSVNTLYEEDRPKSGQSSDQGTQWDRVRHMDDAYLTTGNVWREVFKLEARVGNEARLREVYERWRRQDNDGASVEWARWLLEHGKGKDASNVIFGAGLGETWDGLVRMQ